MFIRRKAIWFCLLIITAPLIAQDADPAADDAAANAPKKSKLRIDWDNVRQTAGAVYADAEVGGTWTNAPKTTNASGTPGGSPTGHTDEDGTGLFTRFSAGYVAPESIVPAWLGTTTRLETETTYIRTNSETTDRSTTGADELYPIDNAAGFDISTEFPTGGGGTGIPTFDSDHAYTGHRPHCVSLPIMISATGVISQRTWV